MVTRAGSATIRPSSPVSSSPRVSAQMSALPRKDTKPEMAVRRDLFTRGHRYRIHLSVPGLSRRTMDIGFTRLKLAVFIDGCFWHGCPQHGMVPKSNSEWWVRKLDGNRFRDAETTSHLRALGWEVLRFWEHEIPSGVADTIDSWIRLNRVRLPV